MSSTAPPITPMSAQVYTSPDPNTQSCTLRLLCKPTPSATTEHSSARNLLNSHKEKQFSEIRIQDLPVDTMHLDEFLAAQGKMLKTVAFVNTTMHFLSTADNIGEPCGVMTALADCLTHHLELDSLEITDLRVHYNDSISASVTCTKKWQGIAEIRKGFAEMVADIEQRGNRGLVQG